MQPPTADSSRAPAAGRDLCAARAGARAFRLAVLLVLAMIPALASAACGQSAVVPPGAAAAGSSPGSSASGSSHPSPTGSGASQATARAATAAAAFDSFDAAFYRRFKKHRTYFVTSTAGGYADFWKQAEMIEMVEDAYDSTRDPRYKEMIVDLETQFLWYYGKTWTNRIWNDDITWAVIAALRAYEITGDRQYLVLAQTNFDAMYARAWTSEFGGGMWWTTAKTQKDVTTTAPAAVAACMLFEDVHDAAYLAKAKTMYAWLRANLYDAHTGAVYDHLSHGANGKGTVVFPTPFTYNQGTFIGAANLLHRLTGVQSYAQDARRTLTWTQKNLTVHGILRSEAGAGIQNGGGFKGIFIRYAVRFARDDHLTVVEPWFALNAAAAWSHRDARGLNGQAWARPTPGGLLYSWDCSAGVVLLEVLSAP